MLKVNTKKIIDEIEVDDISASLPLASFPLIFNGGGVEKANVNANLVYNLTLKQKKLDELNIVGGEDIVIFDKGTWYPGVKEGLFVASEDQATAGAVLKAVGNHGAIAINNIKVTRKYMYVNLTQYSQSGCVHYEPRAGFMKGLNFQGGGLPLGYNGSTCQHSSANEYLDGSSKIAKVSPYYFSDQPGLYRMNLSAYQGIYGSFLMAGGCGSNCYITVDKIYMSNTLVSAFESS